MNINDYAVPAITVICWLVGCAFRNLPVENKWIPCIVGAFGMALGVVGWFVMPGFPADNILSALAVGIVSGLASTGADQVYKQINPSDKGRIVVLEESANENDYDPEQADAECALRSCWEPDALVQNNRGDEE